MRATRGTVGSGLALAAAMCCLAACSSGSHDGDDNGDNGGTVSVDSFLADFQSAFCDNAKKCSPGLTFLICEGSLLSNGGEDPATAVKAGRATFDATKAQACIDAVKNASCSNDLFGGFDTTACDDAFKGTVANGGTCYASQECAAGLCDLTACPGTCQAFAQAGESCDGGKTCAHGLFCDSSTTKCAAQKANGTACESGDECTSGVCDTDGQTGTCAAAPSTTGGTGTAGAKCSGTAECATGFYCKTSFMGGDGACTAKIAKGAKCGENGDFAGAQQGCANNLTCAGASASFSGGTPSFVSGTCSDWSNVGGACTQAPPDSIGAVTGCMFGLVCGSDNKCAKPPATGPCAADASARCAEASYCDQADNTCKARKAPGATCQDGDECQSHACDNGKCTAESVCKP